MRRSTLAIVLVAALVAPAACGRQPTAGEGASSAAVSVKSGPLDIALTTEPAPPRTGDNTFDVVITENAQPLTDADVTLELYMAPMPSMNMPEMRSQVALRHEGGGRYRGTGSVVMAGTWDANVMVMRGGQHLGDGKVTIIAR